MADATMSAARDLGVGWKVLLANESAPREVFCLMTDNALEVPMTTIYLTEGAPKELPADSQVRVVL